MRRIIMVIRDGWGHNPKKEGNAIAHAKTPNTDFLMKNFPSTLLECSGEAVGLPEGYQGNSEVGHMTIGSGRILFQPMVRIDKAISSGEFFRNKAFKAAADNCKKHGSAMHILGLLQSEGVHSHERHLFALLEFCKRESLKKVYVHAILDGRDAPPTDGIKHIKLLKDRIKEQNIGSIATISGRYFAMDRDKRWERTKKAYDCIVFAHAEDEFEDPEKKLSECYAAGETDEFIKPRRYVVYEGVKEHDSIIFFNFRTDRPRQLTQAIVENVFGGWQRKPLNVCFVAMTQYYSPMNALVAFEDQPLNNLLGEIISRAKIKQLRISETEKYAHVTFFFNGQNEKPFDGEDRILIDSPKVATYDLKPEMSAYDVTERLLKEIESNKYGFIVVNLVNGDLVGHTGVWEACIKAAEVVDECLGKICEAGLKNKYTIFVLSDHGNLEDKSAAFSTSHTTNKVPFILVSDEPILKKAKLLKNKGLQDVAPTVLKLLGLPKPKEMTGEILIKNFRSR
ncbi:MAG: 2,3-bisphosphoglycerate-independent phosphoglycerate mutase [Candidatus Diapherotrites archaeon]|nr:2,3-bisphosphoglycerate-independent phosphoglycerate mutase [Candidatus Diapherotrites archaeon]